ncbi:MAG: HAMP domain-containing histidine kinase [Lachnospiraceae bacterium]|nr:HAMP domain-containing histidine kinase [Lachnospiraceae bacterium]
MKNYKKMIFSIAFIMGIALLVFIRIAYQADSASFGVSGENIVMLNRIADFARENRNDLSALDGAGYDADFVILSTENQLLYAHVETKEMAEGLSLEKAIQNRYPYVYVSDSGKVIGTVILLDDGTKGYRSLVKHLVVGMILFCGLLLLAAICYGIYVQKNIIEPFNNLKGFASKVAQGNLDEPLQMNKNNMFGAFTESFDIMREELAGSKERELALQKKEKELVASMSHDLKTPVTGIKLAAELIQMRLSVKTETDESGEKVTGGNTTGDNVAGENATTQIPFTREDISLLQADAEGIRGKAEQIDTLLSDLFTATLDDLGEFKVSCKDEESRILSSIVKSFDDRNLVVSEDIPDVILHTDVKRMSQVIGNILSNSYKYANTKIDISYRVAEHYLEMQIADHGPGVPAGELDLITNKFYRGKDWENTDKDGHGLGLYIAKTLMKRMDGDLIAESDGSGLAITLIIPLA